MEELGKDALKERARQILDQNLADLAQAQDLLYADDRYAVLIVLQAMDAAGKDGTIKHVMSGVNPQGCQVFSFKKPSAEELDHNFLWRYMRCLPERGRIGIFNRSYYEDVLVVKVHPELLAAQRLPGEQARQEVLGRALPGHQRLRAAPGPQRDGHPQVLPERLEGRAEAAVPRAARPPGEALEVLRGRPGRAGATGAATCEAYADCLSATSTEWAPWYVVPADHKWVTRAVVADVITTAIRSLDLKYPEVTDEQRERLAEARRQLSAE